MNKMVSICVIDDDPELNEIYAEALGDHFLVRTFTCGQDVIELLQEGYRPAAIVTDLRMPLLSGFQFLQTLNDLEIYIPTIVVSGHIDSRDLPILMARHVYQCFEKPTALSKIKEAIECAVFRFRKTAKLSELVQESVAGFGEGGEIKKPLTDGERLSFE